MVNLFIYKIIYAYNGRNMKTSSTIILIMLIALITPYCGKAESAMALKSSNSTDYLDLGDLYFTEGNYNESINCYNEAIYLLEAKINSNSTRFENISDDLYDVSYEYEISKEIYQHNEEECAKLADPLIMIDKLLPMAVSVYIELPYKMLPTPLGTIIKTTGRIKSTYNNAIIAGDIFSCTFSCLKWKATYKRENETKMEDLSKESQELQAEYSEIQENYKATLEQLKSAWKYIGIALFKLGGSENSTNANETLIELTKSYESVWWHNQGFLFDVQQNYEESIKCFNEAIEIDPLDPDAWFGKGVVLAKQDKYDDAIKAYDETIKIEPEYVMAWNNKGLALGNLGNYDEALKCFDEAIRINPELPDVWYNKGVILNDMSKRSEADVAFSKAEEVANRSNT
jgi:tetratricopeptide (TPR) repeat protein